MSRLIALLAAAVVAAPFPAHGAQSAAASTSTAPPAALAPANPDRVAGHVNATLATNFAKADQNHDGKLTPAEAKGNMPAVSAQFEKIDVAKSGVLTLTQIEAYFAALRAEHRAKRRAKVGSKADAQAGAHSPTAP